MPDRFAYFDLGNVLVQFEHEFAVRQLADLAAADEDLVRNTVFESNLQNRYETGLIQSSEYVAEINRALETDLADARVLEAISAIFVPNPPILQALTQLRDAGVAMGVLSNTCEAHWHWILAQNWPMLDGWFQQIVLSYEIGSMKPNSKIYEVCEARANCNPASIFFTDDRPENIAAASARGWSTHLFESGDELMRALAVWLAD